MLRHLKLLRNIGQFDFVSSAADIKLGRLVLIYGENGRGKTTLVAILRSLESGDPNLIMERHRLSSDHDPHVVLEFEDNNPTTVIFENGQWNRTLPNLLIFDDLFVNQNVYSGLAVESEHRKNLHEVVLGAEGVELNRRIQDLVRRVEEHNRALREKARAIPEQVRYGLPVDEFCALEARPNIEQEIKETERAFAAAQEQEPVRNTPMFERLNLPVFDLNEIDQILQADLLSLDMAAVEKVQQHLATLGSGGEQWLSEGMKLLPESESDISKVFCPFCAQNLIGSPVIAHYRAYFSEAYANLKQRIKAALDDVERTHGGAAVAVFERSVRRAVEQRQFWSRFCDVPAIEVDTAEIVRDWNSARDAVAEALRKKQAAPLELMSIDDAIQAAVATYEQHRRLIADLNGRLMRTNEDIGIVKEQSAGADLGAIEQNLARLRAVQSRYSPEIAPLCDAYFAEKEAKARTEEQRKQARAKLEDYKTNVFPRYETSVNLYLQRFSAGFRLDSVTSTATRGGPACTYNVLINNTPVPITAAATPGRPSFRNTLSAGDRNTLALAFFLASLDQDPDLANKIVVIDDPISSLDDHRALTTVQQVRWLAERTKQVIVLSHDKRFLGRVWEGADSTTRTALEIVRRANGSTIRAWNVAEDSITEHDRRDEQLRRFLELGEGDPREIARSIRPHLEAYLRVAYPEHFPPGRMLGQFVGLCRQRIGNPDEILDETATQELDELKEYANRFHHDTNPAWETVHINDTELKSFVERTLRFIRR
ncbi:AAA family ATPase [Deinococcota bacterium DY0809b]